MEKLGLDYFVTPEVVDPKVNHSDWKTAAQKTNMRFTYNERIIILNYMRQLRDQAARMRNGDDWNDWEYDAAQGSSTLHGAIEALNEGI